VLDKRESKSRPTQGLVTVKTIGRNQHGTIVMEFERTMLIAKRGQASTTRRTTKRRIHGRPRPLPDDDARSSTRSPSGSSATSARTS